ncbi:MAG TPA: hypothetical protein VGN64_06735 [Dyadobacter sp.]|jgi:hypothetical protein|nr:hypothetical protein [Dyadobacter sp.]
MASIPLKGDRLIAKVKLSVYAESNLKTDLGPMPPGPGALRETWQYPGVRESGEEVGTYTGNMVDSAYEVNYTVQYYVAVQKIFKWESVLKITNAVVWVRKDQVTGGWDMGVDAPKDSIPPPPKNDDDNTNMYLSLAVAAAGFVKFILPRFQK